MKRLAILFAPLLFKLFSTALAAAPLNFITTTTDLSWLAQQLGGENVQVTALLSGAEDPHYVDAVPGYIHLVSNADAICIVGMDLEIGWIPKVLSKSANAQVQPGGQGYCDSSVGIDALDVISGRVDRSMGDVHPDGNPHYHLSPSHMLQAGENILGVLIKLQPDNAEVFIQNFETLSDSLTALQGEIQTKLDPLKPYKFLEYHKDFGYFFDAYGLNSVGALEAVPGVPPSAGRLAKTSISAKKEGVQLLVASSHNPTKVLQRFTTLSGVPFIKVSTSIQTHGDINDYAALQHHLAESILQAAKQN
ncbi:hypothetical protein AB833_02420 [Chromatiales bacterium (ex Bugula neritina AB1)]|nr:hypothetical protein AB833_02420 [Chromatiales bacterium (ex Bugula neritina AB1)]